MNKPDTRAEIKRLFDAPSAGGKITKDLQDMFRDAYYGMVQTNTGYNG
jgi:hypothetical protein